MELRIDALDERLTALEADLTLLEGLVRAMGKACFNSKREAGADPQMPAKPPAPGKEESSGRGGKISEGDYEQGGSSEQGESYEQEGAISIWNFWERVIERRGRVGGGKS